MAYDQACRLATDQEELVTAYEFVQSMVRSGCIDDTDAEQRTQELRTRALNAEDFDQTFRFFSALGSSPAMTAQEQAALAERIGRSPLIAVDYAAVVQTVESMKLEGMLAQELADEVLAGVYTRASETGELDAAATLGLGEDVLKLVDQLLADEQESQVARARALVDLASDCRRKILADRRAPSTLRPRVDALKASIDRCEGELEHMQRVVAARAAVAGDSATAAQRKLLGLWLLEKAKFDEALPHLRASNDSSLEAVAVDLPATGTELAQLADALENEARKTKHPQRAEQALLAYANHVRQLAATRMGDPPAVPGTSPPTTSSDPTWDKVPKGRWQPLLQVLTLDELQNSVQRASRGPRGNQDWDVRDVDGGIIEAHGRGSSTLELPLKPEGSYVIRYICQASELGHSGVVLPLGESAVAFVTGASNGLELVDDKRAIDSQNLGAIPRSNFRYQPGVPVRVEIQIDQMPARTQSTKQRQVSGGVDWVQIVVRVNGVQVGIVAGRHSLFQVPHFYAMSPGVIGFIADVPCQFGQISLLRK